MVKNSPNLHMKFVTMEMDWMGNLIIDIDCNEFDDTIQLYFDRVGALASSEKVTLKAMLTIG